MGEWISKSPMPTPRHDLQAIPVGNRIYAISGGDDITTEVVEVYDVIEDRWRSGPAIPTKRGWSGSALLDDRIYIIAGKTIRTPEEKARTGDDGDYTIRNTVEVLDLASQTWSYRKALSASRAGLAATVCNGRIYAIGGNTMDNEKRNHGTILDRVEIYEPESDTWSPGVPLPVAVQGPVVTTIDDRIYVTAGRSNEGVFPAYCLVLDPETQKWDDLAPIPTPRCDPGSVVVDRRIYTFGGWGPNRYYDNVEIYDIDSDTWSPDAPLPEKKAWMGAAAVGDRIFVMGGAYKKTDGPGFKWIDDLHEFVR